MLVRNEFKGWLNYFSFADENNVWIVGDQGQVYQSTDGGANWQSRGIELSRGVKPGKGSPGQARRILRTFRCTL